MKIAVTYENGEDISSISDIQNSLRYIQQRTEKFFLLKSVALMAADMAQGIGRIFKKPGC